MKSFVILKPDVENPGYWIDKLLKIGQIEHVDFRILSKEMVEALYSDHIGRWYWQRHLEHMTSGACWIVALDCPPEKLIALKMEARTGTQNPRNRIHVSDNVERDIALFGWEQECCSTTH